ncbi:phospholipase A and acyltransferase 2-like [Glandiceps talaboti]
MEGITPWTLDFLNFRKQLKAGDIIEIKHFCYCHAGIFVGYDVHSNEPLIIHLAVGWKPEYKTLDSAPRRRRGPGKVVAVKEPIRYAAGDGRLPVRINNSLDSDIFKPLISKLIIQNGEKMLGKQYPFNVLEDNCQHFATRCRYGDKLGYSWELEDLRQTDNKVLIACLPAAAIFLELAKKYSSELLILLYIGIALLVFVLIWLFPEMVMISEWITIKR